MSDKKNNKKSRFLSLVLRHKPELINISLDEQGWASINDLLVGCKQQGVFISRRELETIVATNDKKRFTICENTNRIKANQGHSVKVDLNLTAVTPPDILFHGTATRFKDSIFAEGLLKMNRHHVHLSSNRQTAIKVGKRHGKLLLLQVNAKKMTEDGYDFYLTSNNVWLVDRVPSHYLTID